MKHLPEFSLYQQKANARKKGTFEFWAVKQYWKDENNKFYRKLKGG